MLKIGVFVGALAAAFTFVSPALSQGNSGKSCEAVCAAKGLAPSQASMCVSQCEAKRGGYSPAKQKR